MTSRRPDPIDPLVIDSVEWDLLRGARAQIRLTGSAHASLPPDAPELVLRGQRREYRFEPEGPPTRGSSGAWAAEFQVPRRLLGLLAEDAGVEVGGCVVRVPPLPAFASNAPPVHGQAAAEPALPGPEHNPGRPPEHSPGEHASSSVEEAHRALSAVTELLASLRRLLERSTREREELERAVAAHQEALRVVTGQVRDERRRREAAEARAAAHDRELEARLTALGGELRERDERLAALASEREELRRRLTHASAGLAERIAELEADLTELGRRTEALAEHLVAERAARSAAEGELAAARERLVGGTAEGPAPRPSQLAAEVARVQAAAGASPGPETSALRAALDRERATTEALQHELAVAHEALRSHRSIVGELQARQSESDDVVTQIVNRAHEALAVAERRTEDLERELSDERDRFGRELSAVELRLASASEELTAVATGLRAELERERRARAAAEADLRRRVDTDAALGGEATATTSAPPESDAPDTAAPPEPPPTADAPDPAAAPPGPPTASDAPERARAPGPGRIAADRVVAELEERLLGVSAEAERRVAEAEQRVRETQRQLDEPGAPDEPPLGPDPALLARLRTEREALERKLAEVEAAPWVDPASWAAPSPSAAPAASGAGQPAASGAGQPAAAEPLPSPREPGRPDPSTTTGGPSRADGLPLRAWVPRALPALAATDPLAAGQLILELLTLHSLVGEGALDYDLDVTGLGTYRVTVRPDRTVIQPVGTDETPAPADFTIRSDIAALAALMAGGPVRRHRFRGRLRIEGRYRGARSLQAIARAEVTLGRLRDTGLAPDPLLVARALAVIGLDA